VSAATRCHGGGDDDVTSGPSTGGGGTGLVTTVGAAASGLAGLLPLVPFSLVAGGGVVDDVVPETVPATVPVSVLATDGLVVTALAGAGIAGAVLAGAGVVAGLLAADLPAPAVFDSTAAVATVRSSAVVSFGAVSGLSGEVTSCP
jgi:hypothetical protein